MLDNLFANVGADRDENGPTFTNNFEEIEKLLLFENLFPFSFQKWKKETVVVVFSYRTTLTGNKGCLVAQIGIGTAEALSVLPHFAAT